MEERKKADCRNTCISCKSGDHGCDSVGDLWCCIRSYAHEGSVHDAEAGSRRSVVVLPSGSHAWRQRSSGV